MGLFDKLFPSKKNENLKAEQTFKLLTGYAPVFQNWDGKIYESELVRTAIDARARHISKLNVRIDGSAQIKLQTRLKQAPNDFITWSQFLYRLSTILDCRGTAFILPTYNRYFDINGLTTILPERYELVLTDDDEPWIRFIFENRRSTAERLDRIGIMTRFQYESDLFGTPNTALYETMQLIKIQNQGIEEAVKSSASYKFMAKVSNFAKSDDLRREQARYNSEHFGENSGGGIILFPNTYSDIQQITSKSYIVDADQMKMIESNVFNYFGVNESILQNTAKGDDLDAFFNGAIEPFAIQLSDVLTKMLFTRGERSYGSEVFVTANRLQYMTVSEKINMAQQLGDRGMIMIDEIRDLFNYPPLPNGSGQRAPIRGEYYFNGEETGNAGEE